MPKDRIVYKFDFKIYNDKKIKVSCKDHDLFEGFCYYAEEYDQLWLTTDPAKPQCGPIIDCSEIIKIEVYE